MVEQVNFAAPKSYAHIKLKRLRTAKIRGENFVGTTLEDNRATMPLWRAHDRICAILHRSADAFSRRIRGADPVAAT